MSEIWIAKKNKYLSPDFNVIGQHCVISNTDTTYLILVSEFESKLITSIHYHIQDIEIIEISPNNNVNRVKRKSSEEEKYCHQTVDKFDFPFAIFI